MHHWSSIMYEVHIVLSKSTNLESPKVVGTSICLAQPLTNCNYNTDSENSKLL